MSLVDSRFPELDQYLQRAQFRLNRNFLLGEALLAWSVAAPLALVALVAPEAARLGFWAELTLLITGGSVLWRARLRLTRHQAASWIDEVMKTGLFRAASESLDRANPSSAALAVLNEATAQVNQGARLRLPLRRLLRRAGSALLVTAGVISLLTTVSPALVGKRTPAAAEEPSSAAAALPPGGNEGARELTPAEAAKRLFPEDSRLAALAEQAIRSGDPGALESLLNQNAASVDQAAAQARSQGSAGSPRPAPGETNGSGDSGPSERQTNPGTNPSQGKGQQKPGSGAPDSKQGSTSDSGKDPGQKSGQAEGRSPTSGKDGADGGRGPGRSNPSSPNDVTRSSGGAPGTGHSEVPFGPGAQGYSGRKLTLKESNDPGLFEYVLPGSEPKLPTGSVLADSSRSAEATVSRTSPPLEFENTIRDYFLSLSQEVSP